ncbi:MAG TPA: hypothetical protein VMU84_19975 [Thermoanaerobaculia bacterium]|nr:hypothetical protein [Thermoanaerobaculia bacterium]
MPKSVTFAFVVLLAIAQPSQAQNCTGKITGFTGTTTTTQYTLKWDGVVGAGIVYEILRETGQSYCTLPNQFSVIATTQSNTFTGNKEIGNVAYGLFVRTQGSPCSATEFTLVTDSFQTPPPKPVISSATAGPSLATLNFSYSDARTFSIEIQRAFPGGTFSRIASLSPCNPDPKTYIDYGPSGNAQTGGKLPPGTYQYRLLVGNDGNNNGLNGIFSDQVPVTIGVAPTISNFFASPPTIRLGRGSTLTFATRNATSVSIVPGAGEFPLSGSVSVTPSKTTTYTLTASNGSLTTTATTTVTVITDPIIAISAFPSALVQTTGSGGAITSYILTNAGGGATTLQLGQSGQFFTQSPSVFTLAPGQSQTITITGLAQQQSNVFEGASVPSGAGVPNGMRIPIKLLSVARPTDTVIAKSSVARVDVFGPTGASPGGTVTFNNSGRAALSGVLISNVPWLIPQGGLVTIPAGGSSTFTFTIDRSKRLESNTFGSAQGNIHLVYPTAIPSGKMAVNADPLPSVSIVSVVDTTTSPVTNGAPPALGPGEIALFIPGVGHITGSVGVFISDVSILNLINGGSVNDLKLFYTPVGGTTSASKTTTVPPVAGSTSVALADVVSTTFGNEAQVGSLQVRSSFADRLSVATNIFNKSNPAGTYGTAIPTFRSDRAVPPGEKLVLSGLKRDATTHTNLFFQETAGVGTTVDTEFLDVNGSTLGTRTDTVGAFQLLQVNSVVPTGAVAAIMTNTGTGRFLSYATPVDEASGDNWSVADWSRLNGYSPSDPQVIPVAGVVHGANNTFFRTDIAITNTTGSQASALLTYLPRGGTAVTQTISLGAKQSTVVADVIGTLFGVTTDGIGYLYLAPTTGGFVVTSRTYTTGSSNPASFGTGVPTLSQAASLKLGEIRSIASLEDSKLSTIIAATPATFRTNFGLLETNGHPATVRATLRFSYPAGEKIVAVGEASKDYLLAATQFLQINGIATDILGAARNDLDDLHGMQIDFMVISGDGAVAVYTSSIDNGTGDAILKTE